MFGNGFTSQVRPKKYYVVPRESLERFTEDVEQLINFFVIEFQRIVFAENVYVTVAVSSSQREDSTTLDIIYLQLGLT